VEVERDFERGVNLRDWRWRIGFGLDLGTWDLDWMDMILTNLIVWNRTDSHDTLHFGGVE